MIARPALVAALLIALSPSVPAIAAPDGGHGGSGGHCARQDRVRVPGAELQIAACLTDLTTAGTVASGHTVPADFAGLTSTSVSRPSGVPGIQIDGYFPDTSTSNSNHGWAHDAQFVLRLPDRWNGGLVVSGSPGTRRQYANDAAIADFVLARGYAFAATDKGNTGVFFTDGATPGAAMREWNQRVTQLGIAARAAVAQRYGRPPAKTVAAGLSNGGYLVRWQLEHNPWLFDGGVDWEGTLWREPAPNLLTVLPPLLRAYPAYAAGSADARQAIIDAGLPAESEFLWPFHYSYYWDLTQRVYREEFDPDFDGALQGGTPFCASGTPACDTDYDYAARPAAVHDAVRSVSLTGRISRPMITLHGTLDALLPISTSSDPYAADIRATGRGALHRYYRVDRGTHVDSLVDAYPDRLVPLEPCFRSAFDAMDRWVSRGTKPGDSLAGC